MMGGSPNYCIFPFDQMFLFAFICFLSLILDYMSIFTITLYLYYCFISYSSSFLFFFSPVVALGLKYTPLNHHRQLSDTFCHFTYCVRNLQHFSFIFSLLSFVLMLSYITVLHVF